MYSFRDAALKWSDPEGVHSMRVASRRLRSALRDFAPYLRKRGLTSVLKQMRNIADALGEVRDQDVAILALEKIETEAPAEFSEALKQFIDARKELRVQSRKELKSILEKNRLKQLKADFIVGLDEATVTHESATRRSPSPAEITFSKMSRTIILDRLKELDKLSSGLFKPFEIDSLHEMRIAAKRLRYAVELFQPCWGNSIATYAKRAARIQTALGEVHDCDVWIESLGKYIDAARKQKQEAQVAALVWLLSHFIKLRTRYLRRAFAHWREWETQDVSSRLKQVTSSDRTSGQSGK
jgi:CHAD domain-containing protein